MHQTRVLFSSPLLSVSSCSCRPAGPAAGEEEAVQHPEIAFVQHGFFCVHEGRERHAVDGNSAYVFSPERPYRVSHPVTGGDVCTVISLGDAALRDLLEAAAPGDARRLPAHALGTTSREDGLQRQLGQPRTALAAEETALLLAGSVLRRALRPPSRRLPGSRAATQRVHRDLVEHAKEALAQGLDGKLSLVPLARTVGTSPFHLSRLFHRHTGLTLTAYHLSLRLRAAHQRILEGEPDLTRLALELGFADHSHFTTAFRRALGTTPSELRRSGRGPQGRGVPRSAIAGQ